MILFLISFLLICSSSYLITSTLAKKNDVCGLFYLPLIIFAQIVLDFEILSLINAITAFGVIVCNVLTLLVTFVLWRKWGSPLWTFSAKRFFKRVFIACCQDKYLFTLLIGFCVFFLVSIFLIVISPVVNADASAYHVARSVFWVLNKNLNHFVIGDIRNIVFPINSEILYAWIILFTKKMVLTGIPSFVGYLLAIMGIYNILNSFKFGMKRILWVIFLVTSFSSVTILSSGTETDILVAGLVLSSIYLFLHALKTGVIKFAPLVISSLAFALAIGTKTTGLFVIPGVALGYGALAYTYFKRDFYKPLLLFMGFGVINFLLFGAYNYILNIINFGNVVGPANFTFLHKNIYGLRAIPVHFLKYLFMFVDFTGFRWADYVGSHVQQLQSGMIAAMGLADINSGIFTSKNEVINRTLLEPLAGMGVVGLLTVLPCALISFIKPFFLKSRKSFVILGFGILFLVNLLVMSTVLIYMTFSIRFLTTLVIISAPILVYSYSSKNNFYKFVVVMFSMFSLVLISTHIWARPFVRITDYLKQGESVTAVRKYMEESILYPKSKYKPNTYHPLLDMSFALRDIISEYDKSNKILYFSSAAESILPLLELNLEGYHIDFNLISNMDEIDLDEYNAVIIKNDSQETYYIKGTNGEFCSYNWIDIKEKHVLLNCECKLPEGDFSKNGFVVLDSFSKITYNQRFTNEKIPTNDKKVFDEYKIYENSKNPLKK